MDGEGGAGDCDGWEGAEVTCHKSPCFLRKISDDGGPSGWACYQCGRVEPPEGIPEPPPSERRSTPQCPQTGLGGTESAGAGERGQSTTQTKYRAQITECDGMTFHSKGEAERWRVLCLREAAGEIQNLRRQVRYDLKVNGCLVSFYRPDFVYTENGREICEDFKSCATKTRAYVMRRKLMWAIYGIEIRETGK